MNTKINVTKRMRKRTLQDGSVVLQLRYVVNYRCPKTDQRKQEFFERQKDAQARQSTLIVSMSAGSYVSERTVPTVNEACDHWLADRKRNVKASTIRGIQLSLLISRGHTSWGRKGRKQNTLRPM